MTSTKKQRPLSAAKRYGQIENISIGGITVSMGPVGLHTYASAFLSAARSLPPPSVPFEPVRPFLVCHSIELALKAFLSLKGNSLVEMAGGAYGHNLAMVLQRADEQRLGTFVSLTEVQRAAIQHASTYYAGKVFEYPAIGEALSAYPDMPALDTLQEVATILVDSLRQHCLEGKLA